MPLYTIDRDTLLIRLNDLRALAFQGMKGFDLCRQIEDLQYDMIAPPTGSGKLLIPVRESVLQARSGLQEIEEEHSHVHPQGDDMCGICDAIDALRLVVGNSTSVTPPAPLSVVSWHGPAEKWVYPFTKGQVKILSTNPCCVDGVMQVFGIGVDSPDLILAQGSEWKSYLDGSDDGDVWHVRFGQMKIEDFTRLPEHEGW